MPSSFWTKHCHTRHQSQTLETERNGLLGRRQVHVYTGTQSTSRRSRPIARWLNNDPEQRVLISEYTGGGFGSKVTAV